MPSSPQPPSTPTPTPSTTLETDLLTHLASTTALEDLHATLLSSLQRTGWTERIRKLATELLRAGRCERFDEVVDAVVATAEGRLNHNPTHNQNGDQRYGHENNDTNGNENGMGGEDIDIDVRIPSAVVEQGVRAIKEVLREVAVRDDESDLLDGSEEVSSGSEPAKVKREGAGAGAAAGDTSVKGNGTGNGTASGEGGAGKKEKKGKGAKSGK